MLLMIDNYDSFTYTLVQYFEALGEEVVVKRNDEITLEQVKALNPDRIVISPGPCTPNEAGVSIKLILEFYQQLPILGVCLGHQAIAQAFGAQVVKAPKVMHGKTSVIEHNGSGLFDKLPKPLTVTRYHSLLVKPETLPDELTTTAWFDDESGQQIMAIKHNEFPVFGVQFHPESVLTQSGDNLLSNFLEY